MCEGCGAGLAGFGYEGPSAAAEGPVGPSDQDAPGEGVTAKVTAGVTAGVTSRHSGVPSAFLRCDQQTGQGLLNGGGAGASRRGGRAGRRWCEDCRPGGDSGSGSGTSVDGGRRAQGSGGGRSIDDDDVRRRILRSELASGWALILES